MGKTCFVIMPISDNDLYAEGHFTRVYEHIIKPACIRARFSPVRADDIQNTNHIAIDIIKRIIISEMAICDLSSRNPNVLYELGIRQSFNLPVTLIKDKITERVFDIQGFRDIEYDNNLRIDNVESTIALLAATIENTYAAKGKEINSLVSLLGIHPATITSEIEISKDTEIVLSILNSLGNRLTNIENRMPRLTPIKPLLIIDESKGAWIELNADEAGKLKIGDIIEHDKFGRGQVVMTEGASHNPIVTVNFSQGDSKKLMTNYAKLKKFDSKE